MKLRTGLFLLVTGTLVPILLLAGTLGAMLIDRERETFRRGALDRNRAVMSAVDAAIQGHVSTLQALAVSSNLASGQFAAFERRLERILASQPSWLDVMVHAPDGRRLANAGPDKSDAVVVEAASFQRALATRVPAVGNLARRGTNLVYGIAVRYPVLDPATREVAWILSAILDPAQFQRLLEAQNLSPGWVSGLVDAGFHFVARVPPRPHDQVASAEFQAAVSRAAEGWYRGKTVEGLDSFTAFVRSPSSGWSLGMAIPFEVVNASSRRTLWLLGLGTLVALMLAGAFAAVAGRRIAAPIAALARAARSAGQGEAPPPVASEPRIEEFAQLRRAVEEAGTAVAERQALRDREQAALREADRAKDEFIAVLGHELRNPLSAISTSVRLLRVAPQGSAAEAQARDIIERQARQMTRLVEDLLDISRLATGKLTLRRETFDLAEAARALVQAWEQSQRLAPGRVRVEASTAMVSADRARVEQVLANLLDNANKFTPAEGSITVRVHAEPPMAVLEVRDEGKGIPPELLPHMFRPFVQGPQEEHRPAGGLGLGLAVVDRLVRLHGGSIAAASPGPGLGATLTVKLPLA